MIAYEIKYHNIYTEDFIQIGPPNLRRTKMVIQKIDDISFPMKEAADFSFLSSYGCVFCVFSQNDSGNISFGTDNGKTKYFIKVAGARTSQSCTGTKEAVNTLKAAIPIYTDLVHPCLIQLLEYFESWTPFNAFSIFSFLLNQKAM